MTQGVGFSSCHSCPAASCEAPSAPPQADVGLGVAAASAWAVLEGACPPVRLSPRDVRLPGLAVHTEADGRQVSMYDKVLMLKPQKESFHQDLPLYIPRPSSRLDTP